MTVSSDIIIIINVNIFVQKMSFHNGSLTLKHQNISASQNLKAEVVKTKLRKAKLTNERIILRLK